MDKYTSHKESQRCDKLVKFVKEIINATLWQLLKNDPLEINKELHYKGLTDKKLKLAYDKYLKRHKLQVATK